ncbi:MAG: hypothetical protein DRP96_05950 [Candidatus Neomarinimicrobiota bacterium]|nr:MAG: hypothetical protein DRP96_05950 [Candidatus Neomarinimicrobiota bacterium]
MGRSIKFLHILFVFGGLSASLLMGAEIRVGQVGFRFLENPVSAEAIGRGGLGLVMLQNSNTVYWNPAGLGWLESKVDINANYTKGIADIDHHSFVCSYRYRSFGVALDYSSVDYGVLIGTRRANTPEGFIETGYFSPQANVIGISLGQKVSHRFSYGLRFKSAYQNLGDAFVAPAGTDVDDEDFDSLIKKKTYDLRVAILDVGAIYDFQSHGIRFGATINNISREVKYVNNSFPLPFSVNFALTVNPLSFLPMDLDIRSLILGVEVSRPRDFDERIRVGAEYNYHDLLIARVGYMGNYDERGITFGVGLRKSIANTKIRVDYAYQDFGIFNGIHTFSTGFSH